MPVSAALSMMVVLHLMMPYRRGMALRPINSVKNIIDGTFLAVAAGVTTNVVLATTVNDYTGGVTEVPIGAKVSSIYLFVQVLPTAGTANVDFYVAKKPDGVSLPVAGATGGSPARKFILHEEKGIPGNAADGAYPLTFKGVIKIPKGRQRFAEGDDLILNIRGADIYNACVKCIYKFYQ